MRERKTTTQRKSWDKRLPKALTAAYERVREALLTARPYVEAACGARGLTAGMAEANLKRIDAALTSLEGAQQP
jgi:hypothetical protein